MRADYCVITDSISNEKIYTFKHESGLKIFVYPIEGSSAAYAIFGAKYGSIDNSFKTGADTDFVNVTDGIAHFLEHKLFENEDCDAFSRYAKTGADANAYTSFDKTCYLFSCTDMLTDSLEILLDFVQSPYFTKQTVEKEQGIIAQEIRMYDDSPQWRVYFNLLRCMYHNHPVRRDIAGTVESISKIDAETLYKCYNTFYNLNNMVLCVAGKVGLEEVLEICNKFLKPSEPIAIERSFPNEPYDVKEKNITDSLPVSMPIFMLGFKEHADVSLRKTVQEVVATKIILEAIAGEASSLYKLLLDEKLINHQFGFEYFEGPGYSAVIFSGESSSPETVKGHIFHAVESIKVNGIDNESFEGAKRKIYGRLIASLATAENVCNNMAEACFSDRGFFDELQICPVIDLETINNILSVKFDINNTTMSIVR